MKTITNKKQLEKTRNKYPNEPICIVHDDGSESIYLPDVKKSLRRSTDWKNKRKKFSK
jgi:hypothetical protein